MAKAKFVLIPEQPEAPCWWARFPAPRRRVGSPATSR